MEPALYLVSDGQYNPEPHSESKCLDTSTVIIVEGEDAIEDAITKLSERLSVSRDAIVVNPLGEPFGSDVDVAYTWFDELEDIWLNGEKR